MSEFENGARIAEIGATLHAHQESCAVRFAALDRRIDNEVATRFWVREELHAAMKPLADAQIEMANTQKTTGKQIEELTATQNEAMKQRMEHEKTESEARVAALQASSFQNVMKRWWFWLLAGLAFLPQLQSAYEAFSKLSGLSK